MDEQLGLWEVIRLCPNRRGSWRIFDARKMFSFSWRRIKIKEETLKLPLIFFNVIHIAEETKKKTTQPPTPTPNSQPQPWRRPRAEASEDSPLPPSNHSPLQLHRPGRWWHRWFHFPADQWKNWRLTIKNGVIIHTAMLIYQHNGVIQQSKGYMSILQNPNVVNKITWLWD